MEEPSGLTLFISWLPIFLYLATMIFVVKMMGQMNRNMERIADALENRPTSGE